MSGWLEGLESIFQLYPMLFLSVGMIIGLVFGAVPGLGGTTALALLMPLTYGMDTMSAMALAGGCMGAVPMGGSISAILINTPGSAPNAATCLDGYPLAQQGKAGLAIGAAASANAVGGLIGAFSLVFILPISESLVMSFGPPEFFLLSLLALVMVASASRGKMLRGLIAGGVGLMIAFIGFDQVTGAVRYTFGTEYLWDGIHLVPMLIGLFAGAEMIKLWQNGGSIAETGPDTKIDGIFDGLLETFRHWPTVLRGSLIGTVVGTVPGVGGTVASLLSYSLTVQVSKDPESFGKGNIQGVIAPEACINAQDCSSLIPTIAFGIPSGAEMAVFLGILILHGMQPGPLMLIDNKIEIYGLVWSLTIACVLAGGLGILVIKPLSRITAVPARRIAPIIMVLALVGSWAIDQAMGNVVVTAVFGLLGYLMARLDYPRLPLVISIVLGAGLERNLHQSMAMSEGSAGIFVERPITLILLTLIVLGLAWTPVRSLFGRIGARKGTEGERGLA